MENVTAQVMRNNTFHAHFHPGLKRKFYIYIIVKTTQIQLFNIQKPQHHNTTLPQLLNTTLPQSLNTTTP